jgi:hypothetical protein
MYVNLHRSLTTLTQHQLDTIIASWLSLSCRSLKTRVSRYGYFVSKFRASYSTSITFRHLDENSKSGLSVWENWAWVHSAFSAVWQFPRAYITSYDAIIFEATFIAPVAGSLTCFLFFGTSKETLAANRRLGLWLWSQLACVNNRLDTSTPLPIHRSVYSISLSCQTDTVPRLPHRGHPSALTVTESNGSTSVGEAYHWRNSAVELPSTSTAIERDAPNKDEPPRRIPDPTNCDD